MLNNSTRPDIVHFFASNFWSRFQISLVTSLLSKGEDDITQLYAFRKTENTSQAKEDIGLPVSPA